MAAKSHSRSKAKREDVEWRPVEDVIPYARNPRQATETAISKVAGSIKEFGFRVPIIVDGEGVIIAGHTRLLAAQRLEMETVPVLEAADLTPAQVKAFRIADNRVAEEADWDRRPCCTFSGHLLALGNIRDTTIAEAWRSVAAVRLRESSDDPVCQHCVGSENGNGS
jgi:hypothetical protein